MVAPHCNLGMIPGRVRGESYFVVVGGIYRSGFINISIWVKSCALLVSNETTAGLRYCYAYFPINPGGSAG